MEEQTSWSCDELQSGICIFRNILTDFGQLDAVYLGPGGAFIELKQTQDPGLCCVLLKDLLHISRLQLHSSVQGLYDPVSDTFSAPLPQREVEAFALSFVDGNDSWLGYSPDDLRRMGDRLKRADAFARGCFCNDEGRIYVRHRDVFREVSDVDPNLLYYLTLFGGALGIHRFFLGKFWSGLLYLFSGGLFLTGWACDLLFLFAGYFRDKRKRVLSPPKNRLIKALFIPAGLLVSGFILIALLLLFHTAAHGQFALFFVS